MALDFAPPRYAQLVTAIQERISSGAYAPGSLMPTEAQLGAEFDVSRATVVRALQLLKAEGWVESRQGRGTFVRTAPGPDMPPGRRGRLAMDLPELPGSDAVTVLHAGSAKAPADVAAALGLTRGGSAVQRQRLLSVGGEPSELVTAWFPLDVAEGTSLGDPDPLPEGTAAHLARQGVRMARLSERVTARMSSAEEARILAIPRRVPVLDLLVTAFAGDGRAIQAVSVVLPGDRHELEDSYPA